jgi:hypothetical protein
MIVLIMEVVHQVEEEPQEIGSMKMGLVKDYKGKAYLIKKIVEQYIEAITEELDANQSLLDDENWASDKEDEYHVECRAELKRDNETIRNQLKLLLTNKH